MEQCVREEVYMGNYRLVLSTTKGIYFFLPQQIVRLEARSNYTRIYFSNHYPLLTSKVLKNYETILRPYGFIRTHRSHLVNKNLIMKVDNEGDIVMQDMSKAEISRRKRSKVMIALLAPASQEAANQTFQNFIN